MVFESAMRDRAFAHELLHLRVLTNGHLFNAVLTAHLAEGKKHEKRRQLVRQNRSQG